MLGAAASAYAASALILLGFAVLLVGIFLRSFGRNRGIYGRPPGSAMLIAFVAAWFWPLTLLYWALGPTPEREMRKRVGRGGGAEALGYRLGRRLHRKDIESD